MGEPSVLDRAQERISQLLRTEDAQWKSMLAKMESASGVAREHLFYGVVSLLGFYLVVGGAAQLVCNLIGFAGPAYFSMIAIRSTDKDDDTQWLVYWTIFACFSLVDGAADQIYSYFPFYWVAKAFFLVWLWHEKGALVVWDKVLGPIFDKYQALNNAPSVAPPPGAPSPPPGDAAQGPPPEA